MMEPFTKIPVNKYPECTELQILKYLKVCRFLSIDISVNVFYITWSGKYFILISVLSVEIFQNL